MGLKVIANEFNATGKNVSPIAAINVFVRWKKERKRTKSLYKVSSNSVGG
jgi:hypothetical protein